MKNVSLETRIMALEGTVKSIKTEMYDVLEKAYNEAVERQDEETASELARKIRNKMLYDSDKEFTFDRLSLDLSSITNFIFSLKMLKENEWGIYRQALRDLPSQEGFPFNIKFPKSPKDKDGEDVDKFR